MHVHDRGFLRLSDGVLFCAFCFEESFEENQVGITNVSVGGFSLAFFSLLVGRPRMCDGLDLTGGHL